MAGPAESLCGAMFNTHSPDKNAVITYGLSKVSEFTNSVAICIGTDRIYITNEEFCTKDNGFFIKHDELCTKHNGFCTKTDEFCRSRPGFGRWMRTVSF